MEAQQWEDRKKHAVFLELDEHLTKLSLIEWANSLTSFS